MDESVSQALVRENPKLDLCIDDDTIERYARDYSPFRIRPAAVAKAHDAEDVAAAICAASEQGAPVTARAGGSSVAGQCLGSGLVVDTSALESIEVEGDVVSCGCGVNLDELNSLLAKNGRTIGPDVTSSQWARVGGLLSTNACGARSIRHGRFGDILIEVDVVWADGGQDRLRPGEIPDWLKPGMQAVDECLDAALKNWPSQHRSYGGYRLDAYREHRDVLSLVPGSEGTLCVITGAKLKTVPLPERREIVMLEFESILDALEVVQEVSATGASAVELLDSHVLNGARAQGEVAFIGEDTGAILLVEYLDHDGPAGQILGSELAMRTRSLDGADAKSAWSLRRQALSLTTDVGRVPIAMFEDPAVEPSRARPFCESLLELLSHFGLEAVIYGHAAATCLHVRPLCDPADLELAARLELAAPAVAELVREHGGAVTGEHGWGHSRSYLAREALGSETYGCFEQVKRAFDPGGVLNPGIIVGGVEPFTVFRP